MLSHGCRRKNPLGITTPRRWRKCPDCPGGPDSLLVRRHGRHAAIARLCRICQNHRTSRGRSEAGQRNQHGHCHARLRHRPERRQPAESRLHRPLHGQDGQKPRTGPGEPDAVGRAGCHHVEGGGCGFCCGTVLSARPRVDENFNHRRQRRRKLGRFARAEIRRHPQLHHGNGGRVADR